MEIRANYNQNGVDVVLDYFEDTYIGRQRRGRPRDIPMFPAEIWGTYDRTVNQLPRTNNHLEAWHKRFQNTCGFSHPNIWKFLNVLKNEESLIHAEYQQALGGHPAPAQKRTYADSAARVLNVVNGYQIRRPDILGYMRAISRNIKY